MTTSTLTRLALGAILSFGALLPTASPSLAQAAADCPAGLPLSQPGKLVMSINATIPPTQYIDKDGKLVGLNVDLGNEIAKRLCLEPVFQNVSFEVQIPGLQTKRWDMINTGLYYNEDRVKIMQLVPYSVDALALIVAAGNPLGVKSAADLAGKVVGVEIGGFEEKKLREINDEQVKTGMPAMDVRVFNTYGDTFLALGAGQIEAVFAGDSVGKYYQEQGKFTMAVTGLYPGSPAAFATIEPKLAEAVVAALNAMLADGTYVALMDKTGATKIDVWPQWKGAFVSYFKP